MFTCPDFPERLTVELTNRCNYSCTMCPSRLNTDWKQGDITEKLFKKLIDEAAEHLPVALAPFFRGESLLHENIVGLVAYAVKKGLGPIQMATNGSLLTESLALQLLETGIDFLSFSLDSMDPGEYAGIRRGGRLVPVVKNIEKMLQLRDKGRYKTQIQISATKTRANRDSISNLINYWRNRVDRVRVYYEHSADGYTGSLSTECAPDVFPRKPCQKVFTDMVVYYDGSAACCNHDWFRENPLGGLNRQAIKEVWSGPQYSKLRQQHNKPALLDDPTCLHCDHWKLYYMEQKYIGELYTPDKNESDYEPASQPSGASESQSGPADLTAQ